MQDTVFGRARLAAAALVLVPFSACGSRSPLDSLYVGSAGAGGILGFGGAGVHAGTGGGAGTGRGPGGSGGSGAAGDAGGSGRLSCAGLAATCGPNENDDCCASTLMPGGSFYRSYDGVTFTDKSNPASVSAVWLDVYEITVGRFRKFVDAGLGTQTSPPPSEAGANPYLPNSGWDSSWNQFLVDANGLSAALKCGTTSQIWTDSAGPNDSLPMPCITWYEAFAFCSWDGGRLPTEAEWNYAASGGEEQRPYPWGSAEPGPYTDLANYGCYRNGGYCDAVAAIAPPGASPMGSGKWGQMDLAGNVWEWILDWYGDYPNPCHDCALLSPPSARAIRGGGYVNDAPALLSSSRNDEIPVVRDVVQGARCARSAP